MEVQSIREQMPRNGQDRYLASLPKQYEMLMTQGLHKFQPRTDELKSRNTWRSALNVMISHDSDKSGQRNISAANWFLKGIMHGLPVLQAAGIWLVMPI